MKIRTGFVFLSVIAVLLLCAPAIAQGSVDDGALQAARERAKATVEKAYQHHWKIRITLATNESFKGHVERLQFEQFTFRTESPRQAREIPFANLKDAKRAGLSAGKKWAIAAAAVAGFCVTAVVVTKPWRSE